MIGRVRRKERLIRRRKKGGGREAKTASKKRGKSQLCLTVIVTDTRLILRWRRHAAQSWSDEPCSGNIGSSVET